VSTVGRASNPTWPAGTAERLEASIARIFDAGGGVVGAGFVASEGHVLTCAHVVARALGMEQAGQAMPEADLTLDFPLVAQSSIVAARPILWRPIDPAPGSPKGMQDIAVLRLLTDPPSLSRPCPLVSSTDLWGHTFRAFGFPARRDDGVWAAGVLRGRQAAGWVQIEDVDQTGYRVEPGFSGAPVWDEVLGGVVGMAVAADAQPEARAAYMIPTPALVSAWPGLGTQTTSPPGGATGAWLHCSAPRTVGRLTTASRFTSSTGLSLEWPFVGRGSERTLVADAIRAGRCRPV